jgi:hypothetical protein
MAEAKKAKRFRISKLDHDQEVYARAHLHPSERISFCIRIYRKPNREFVRAEWSHSKCTKERAQTLYLQECATHDLSKFTIEAFFAHTAHLETDPEQMTFCKNLRKQLATATIEEAEKIKKALNDYETQFHRRLHEDMFKLDEAVVWDSSDADPLPAKPIKVFNPPPAGITARAQYDQEANLAYYRAVQLSLGAEAEKKAIEESLKDYSAAIPNQQGKPPVLTEAQMLANVAKKQLEIALIRSIDEMTPEQQQKSLSTDG